MARLDKKVKALIAVASCSLLIAFCLLSLPARAADNDQGVLEIQLKDHREAIDDFAKLDITVDKILISPKPGLMFWQSGWKELTPSTATIDLTQYINKKSARIFRSAINAGSFDALDIKIKSSEAVLKKTRRAAQVKNTVGPIKITFQVPAKGETLLVLDLVVTDFSDHPPRGYELGIQGYELYVNGRLMEKIPPG